MTTLAQKIAEQKAQQAAALAAQQQTPGSDDPKLEGGTATLDTGKVEGGTVLQEGATEVTGTGAPTLAEAEGTMPLEGYQSASLPPEVLAKLMESQEFAGLSGPITEDTTAQQVVDDLQVKRQEVLEGTREMPLEMIDKAIATINSTSDNLIYEEQLRRENEEHERIKAEADEEVARIAEAGGDVAYTAPLQNVTARAVGHYGYIPGEVDYDFSTVDLGTLPVLRTLIDDMQDLRELLASHNINIARMNPFAGSQIDAAVKKLDYNITMAQECYTLTVEANDAEG